MDIYVVCDSIAVIIALGVWFKSRSTESLLLAVFFTTTSILSFGFQEIAKYASLDLHEFWIAMYSAIILFFTLASQNSKIKLAYIAQAVTLGLYVIHGFSAYPVVIYGIFAIQLWVSLYAGSNRGSRGRNLSSSASV